MGTLNTLHTTPASMACHIRCDSCDLDRRFEDCVTAHRVAKEHETDHADHFVSLRDPA